MTNVVFGKPYYKAEELMDTFYISRSTLTQDLNRARTLIAKFGLEIDVNLRHGIGVTGNGLDKRLCIAEYFFRYDDRLQVMVQRQADGAENDWDGQRETIAEFVCEACRKNKLRLSPFLAMDLASHMYVSVLRIKAGYQIGELPGVFMEAGYGREWYAAGVIADKLEKLYQLFNPEKERAYFALHILSKKMPGIRPVSAKEHATLKQCVAEILQEVKDNRITK